MKPTKNVYIDLGAGSLDEQKTNYFYEYVKNDFSENKKIVCVEANDIHIDDIKSRFQDFNDLIVYNLAIVDDKKINKVKLFYCTKDAPDYQVSSLDIEHVKKHYPNEQILSKSVSCMEINTFLENFKKYNIEYLKLDIEGVDEKILTSINFKMFTIKNISIEKLHLEQRFKTIYFLLKNFYFPNYKINELSRFDSFFSKKDRNIKNTFKFLKFLIYLILERIFFRIWNMAYKYIRKYEI